MSRDSTNYDETGSTQATQICEFRMSYHTKHKFCFECQNASKPIRDVTVTF